MRVRAPMMLIHTFPLRRRLGPPFRRRALPCRSGSAGANPGPPVTATAGPLAVTDANVMLGKLIAGTFSGIFGPEQNLPLDVETRRERFVALAAEIGDGREPETSPTASSASRSPTWSKAIKKIS